MQLKIFIFFLVWEFRENKRANIQDFIKFERFKFKEEIIYVDFLNKKKIIDRKKGKKKEQKMTVYKKRDRKVNEKRNENKQCAKRYLCKKK